MKQFCPILLLISILGLYLNFHISQFFSKSVNFNFLIGKPIFLCIGFFLKLFYFSSVLIYYFFQAKILLDLLIYNFLLFLHFFRGLIVAAGYFQLGVLLTEISLKIIYFSLKLGNLTFTYLHGHLGLFQLRLQLTTFDLKTISLLLKCLHLLKPLLQCIFIKLNIFLTFLFCFLQFLLKMLNSITTIIFNQFRMSHFLSPVWICWHHAWSLCEWVVRI